MSRVKKYVCIGVLTVILILCMSFMMSVIGHAQSAGTLILKDTAAKQAVMITHGRPHGKDGVIVEFDLITAPSKTDGSETENNRIRLFAGMTDNYLYGSNTLAGTGLQAAGLAIDVLTNKIMYYPNGLCYGAAATLTGSADNGVTAVDTWNYTTEKPLFEEGYTYRAVYDFTPSDYTDSMILQRKSIGGTDEFATILTVNNYVDPFTGTSHVNSPAVNKTESGYAGIIFEDVNAEIDNFNIYELNGGALAKESFNGEIVYSAAPRKIKYDSLIISVYDRAGDYGLMGVTQDSGGEQLTVTENFVEGGVDGIDSIGGTITLSESEIAFNTSLTDFDPYLYMVSVTDETVVGENKETDITSDFSESDKISVSYLKDGQPVTGINRGDEGNFVVQYEYTDAAGNRDFALLKVTASASTIYFTVSGKITSMGKPIEGATIKFGTETFTTDSEGAYSFDAEAESEINASVSALGYYDANISLTRILKDEKVDIEMTPDKILWFEPHDNVVTTLSMGTKHSADGFIMEFDLLEGLSYTNNYYVGVMFYAGLSESSLTNGGVYTQITNESGVIFELNRNQTGLTYAPIAYGTYGTDAGDDTEVIVIGDSTRQTLSKTGGSKGVATAVLNTAPFATGGSFRVTFNMIERKFILEKKQDDVYHTCVTIEGIKQVGAGYGGIDFDMLGAKLDNIRFTELTGAVIADTEFEKSIKSVDGALEYEGVVLASVLPVVDNTPTTYRNVADVFRAGINGQDVDCGSPVINLSQDYLKFNIEETLSPFNFITSVTDEADELNATENFESLGVSVNIYKDGSIVSAISGEGKYTLNYTYTDEDGNIGYANLAVDAYIKTIIGLAIKGNYQTQVEIGSVFDVSGKKLLIYYNDDTTEEINLAESMIVLDTSSLGNKFMSLTYEGFTQSNYDSIEVVQKQLIVKGKVTCNSSPVAEVKVSFGNGQVFTDAEGNYSFKIAQGSDFTVTFSKDGYISATQEVNNLQEEKTLNIELAKEQVVISGTVSGYEGDMPIKVYYGEKYVETDENGKFEFSIDKGSDITVKVEIDGYEKFEQTFENVSGNTKRDITLVKGAPTGKSGCNNMIGGSELLILIGVAAALVMIRKRRA